MIVKLGLISPVLDTLFPIICDLSCDDEEDSESAAAAAADDDDDDDALNPSSSALQVT